ncbi:class I SAM-dependent methyltransferase, partial [Candidatus Bathyarchaeota archaeon]|nr:class I SAM-dependent methyltransferase [Candidatus Bathyarchaeota archaeon]
LHMCQVVWQVTKGREMEELAEANENTKKSYDLVAEKYHELFKDEMKQKEFDRLLLDMFANYFDTESTICDMGCGPSGHIARHLYDKGLNVFGIDISEKCIEIAQRESPEMKVQTMDMTRLDIVDEAIDGIISFYSIIHTPKQFVEVLFSEFKRVLRKGGKILVVVKKGPLKDTLTSYWDTRHAYTLPISLKRKSRTFWKSMDSK